MANSYSNALRGSSKPQSSSSADTSIDDGAQYTYRDGGVESAEGGSGQRVVSGCSSTGDPDTRLVVTTDVLMQSTGCNFWVNTENCKDLRHVVGLFFTFFIEHASFSFSGRLRSCV